MEKDKQEVELVEAVVTEGEATDKKQVSWNKFGDSAIANFPNGKQIHFDLKLLDTQVLKFYGAKQWLADQVSAIKDPNDKLLGMMESYKFAANAGLELSPTGKVGIIGRVRSNAGAGASAKKFEADIKAQAQIVSLEGLLMKKAISSQPNQPEFTTDDQKKLDEFLMRIAQKNK